MIICISMIFLSDFLWTEIDFSKLISRNASQNIRIKKLFIESFSPRREFQNDSRIIKIEWREPYLITFCLFKMFKSQGHFFDKYLFRFYLSSTSACNDPMSCDFSFFSYHFPRLGAQRGARVWVSSSEKKSFDTIMRTPPPSMNQVAPGPSNQFYQPQGPQPPTNPSKY